MSEDPSQAVVQEQRFPCGTCGSDLRFEPSSQQLVCDHCGNTEMVHTPPGQTNLIRELDFRQAVADTLSEGELEQTRATKCPNCGAQVEFADASHATECPFCATPVVADTGTHRQIKPRAVMPFNIEESDARAAMTNWLGSLWFAPKGLQEYAKKGRKLNGIYVPYWTYDARTQTRYTGERGTVYYETKRVQRNGKTVTERVAKTRWRNASGQVARDFDDVLVLASQSLPKAYTDALSPWDLSALTPYSPQYLAGFNAEGYTIDLDDGFTEAREYMDRMITRDIKFDIGGDRQRIHSTDTNISDVTFKHVLLPIWLAAYKYRGKSYRFVVNGQSGAVKGERPYSAIKITFAVIVGLIIAAAIGYLIAQSQ